MKKAYLTTTLLFSILLGFQSCSLPEVKQAEFERDTVEVINDLKKLSDFEDAGIYFSARSFKEETTYILRIQLVNGKNLSTDASELKELGKEALVIVVNSIENEIDYDKFQVVFVQSESIGPVSSSSTEPFEYTLADLK